MLVQASIVFAVLSILLLYIIVIKKTKTLAQVLILFIIQVIISQIVYALFGLVEDEKTYHATGLKLMDSLNAGEGYQNFGVGPGKQSFTYILGTIYFWFGPYPIVGMLVNALIMSSIPPILVMACNNLGLSKIANLSSWIFVFMPSLVFWAPGLRRESLAFAIIALSILAVSLVYKSKLIPSFLLTLILIYAIQITRQPLFLILLPGLLISFLLRPKANLLKNLLEGKNRITNFYIVNFLIIYHSVFLYSALLQRSSMINGYLIEVSKPEFSTSVIGASWETNSSFLGYSYNIFRAFSGPPAWEWNSISMVIFGIEGITYFLICITVIWSFIKSKNYTKQIIILLSCSIPLLLLSSLVLANYGINSRIRAHYLIPFLPIGALFLQDVINFMARKRNLRMLKIKLKLLWGSN
jgi:hypothetical protein